MLEKKWFLDRIKNMFFASWVIWSPLAGDITAKGNPKGWHLFCSILPCKRHLLRQVPFCNDVCPFGQMMTLRWWCCLRQWCVLRHMEGKHRIIASKASSIISEHSGGTSSGALRRHHFCTKKPGGSGYFCMPGGKIREVFREIPKSWRCRAKM